MVRVSTGALTKASLRSWPFCAKALSEAGCGGWLVWLGTIVEALTEAACAIEDATSRIPVEANNRLKRAASTSWSSASPFGIDCSYPRRRRVLHVQYRPSEIARQWRPERRRLAGYGGVTRGKPAKPSATL